MNALTAACFLVLAAGVNAASSAVTNQLAERIISADLHRVKGPLNTMFKVCVGAGRANVFRLIVGQGLRLSLLGIGIGTAAALVLTGALRSLLVGVRPTDPATFAGIAAMFLAIAAIASGVPACRAARLDPNVALRDE